MYFGPWNDLVYAGWYGYSFLLDNPNNQRFMPPCDYSDYLANPTNYSCKPCGAASLQDDSDCYADYEMFLNLPDSPGFELVHSNIGELNSIDLYFVRVPPSLSALYSTFQGLVSQLVLSSDEFATAMSKIPNLLSDPVPPAWILPDFMYMGGDPTCLSRQPTSFVQTSFAFDVSCSTEEAQSILLTPSNTLFALWATSQTDVCDVLDLQSFALEAVNILNQKYPSTSSSYHSLIQAAYNDIGTLGVSTIQLAVNTSDDSNQFLRQQILGGHSATQWDVFGWIYTYEWAQGFREVVSFEGDANILPLISDKYSPVINEAQPLEVPTSSCQYLWSVPVVVSTIIFFVGLIVIFYSFLLHGRIVGRNLFQFNRVVGAVWLGRPILLVRSLTAIILLCTSPLKFQRHNGNAVFEFKPRSFVESLVVAGESTWISYVINDVLLVLTANNQPHYAPVSTWIGWLIMAVFDIASPYRVKANMNRQCSIDYLNKKLTCTSAEIYVGSVERAITLALIQIGSVSIAFLLNSIWMWLKRSTSKSSNSHLLLSGTAIAFLHKDTLPNGAWMFDRVSCVLCGLITFRKSIFDVKLWILVPDKPFTKPHIKWKKKVFDPPFLAHPLHHDPTVRHVVENSTQVVPVGHPLKLMHRVMMLAGLLYVGATIFGSVIYLNLTANNMANDLWWANYNATREHVYVSRLYNWHLNIRPHGGDVSITDAKFMDDANYTTSLAKGVSATMKPYYISRILSTDATDLSTVIHSLRVMDACLAPWISVQYCWLDFHMNWEMANSAARQIRCANNYSTNAAVYLESVLRNRLHWAHPSADYQMGLHGGTLFKLEVHRKQMSSIIGSHLE
ncbi:hypothetical protein LEN26_002105 [Aphanomyces euteiches]|nr:hypothetical protein LEN26_002105 [Aphanomyces euteiches]